MPHETFIGRPQVVRRRHQIAGQFKGIQLGNLGAHRARIDGTYASHHRQLSMDGFEHCRREDLPLVGGKQASLARRAQNKRAFAQNVFDSEAHAVPRPM